MFKKTCFLIFSFFLFNVLFSQINGDELLNKALDRTGNNIDKKIDKKIEAKKLDVIDNKQFSKNDVIKNAQNSFNTSEFLKGLGNGDLKGTSTDKLTNAGVDISKDFLGKKVINSISESLGNKNTDFLNNIVGSLTGDMKANAERLIKMAAEYAINSSIDFATGGGYSTYMAGQEAKIAAEKLAEEQKRANAALDSLNAINMRLEADRHLKNMSSGLLLTNYLKDVGDEFLNYSRISRTHSSIFNIVKSKLKQREMEYENGDKRKIIIMKADEYDSLSKAFNHALNIVLLSAMSKMNKILNNNNVADAILKAKETMKDGGAQSVFSQFSGLWSVENTANEVDDFGNNIGTRNVHSESDLKSVKEFVTPDIDKANQINKGIVSLTNLFFKQEAQNERLDKEMGEIKEVIDKK